MLCALLAAALLAPSQVMVAYVVPAMTAPTFAPPSTPTVAINEVESNGNAADWVEVMNVGAQAVDISGCYLLDNGPVGIKRKHATARRYRAGAGCPLRVQSV